MGHGVYLALYKGKGLIGNAVIRKWTRSIYSHCELVVDGVCYSSSLMDKGVRSKQINLNDGNWDLIELPERFGKYVLDYFAKTHGQRYGWLDLIRSQLFNLGSDEPGASFCSEWCAAALGIPSPTIYSPDTLGKLVRAMFKPPLAPERRRRPQKR